MSQLDNKNMASRTFFGLLIFSIICVAVTVGLIYDTLTMQEEAIKQQAIISSQKEETEVRESTVERLKLTDKYFTNGIIVEERRITDGPIIYQYEDNVQRKLDITYIQISGLKNIRNSR